MATKADNLFTILSDTQDNNELPDFVGSFIMHCEKYGTAPVKVQKKGKLGTWATMRYNGAEVQFSAAGDTIDIDMTENYSYKLITATPGAVITMDRAPG